MLLISGTHLPQLRLVSGPRPLDSSYGLHTRSVRSRSSRRAFEIFNGGISAPAGWPPRPELAAPFQPSSFSFISRRPGRFPTGQPEINFHGEIGEQPSRRTRPFSFRPDRRKQVFVFPHFLGQRKRGRFHSLLRYFKFSFFFTEERYTWIHFLLGREDC